MNEVKVFNAQGELKHIVSVEELLAISDRKIAGMLGGGVSFTGETRRIPFKTYYCNECRVSFKSNSTRGAKYCKDCRKTVYRIRKKNSKNKKEAL